MEEDVLNPTHSTTSNPISLLSSLIQIRSENPPGNEDEIISFAEAVLTDCGIASTRVPLEEGRSSLVARIAGQNRGSIVLCGHVDTVRGEVEQWSFDPLSGQVHDGRIWGLGSADMKGGVAAILHVVCELKRQSVVPAQDVVLVLTADEECAYRGAASVAKAGHLKDAALLIIAEPTAERAYIGQKGELWVEATFQGQEAHGSMPEKGVNAILPAARFAIRMTEEARKFAFQAGRGRTSLNIGELHGGRQINIVPDSATVSLDTRVITEEDREQFVRCITDVGNELAAESGTTFSFKISNDKAPIVSDSQHPLISQFLRVFADAHATSIQHEIVPYSTDAVEIVPRIGVPLIVYGPGNIEQAHRQDEFLELASFEKSIEVFARFVATATMAANATELKEHREEA